MTPVHLGQILRDRARQSPQLPAFTYLEDGDSQETRVTFAELDLKARRVAAALGQRGARGDRVLLCYPPGLEYVVAFFGCVYAGAIAVPAFPPDPTRMQRTLPRLRAILEDSGAALALAPAALATQVQDLLRQHGGRADLRCLATDDLPGGDEGWEPPELGGGELAFLMYTSGSTGTPKGVMVSHANAVHNITAFHGFAARPCRTFVSWLPLFHDLGLVVATLYPVYQGAHCVMMSPLAFMQRPLRWLKAISRYRATTTAGPNFAYELCARRTRPEERAGLDLSSLNLALNGAEPVRAHTLERFAAAFAPCGFRREAFYPAYGLSDATADASGSSRFQPPTVLRVDRRALERREVIAAPEGPGAVSLVGCGEALPGQRMRVVDPETRRALPDGRVGEIWISGPSVAGGYWGRPRETERLFAARLADGGDGDADAASYFRTGDLGFWHSGEIFVVGRLGDMLILHGSNYFPEDVEPVIEHCHPALRPGGGAVFSVEADDEEHLAVVHEVERDRLGDPDEVFRAIRRAVAEHHEVEVGEIALIPAGELLKTSSGKVRRRACREQLLDGTLKVLARWRRAPEDADAPPAAAGAAPPPEGPRRAAAIEGWLVEYFARRLGLPRTAIDVAQPFASFGLPSVEAVRLVGELGDWLGASLPPTLAWDHPSIDRMVRHLAGGEGGKVERPAAAVAQDAPIAIVGIGCRFPGADTPEALWDLLAEGRDPIREVPGERWDLAAFYDADPATPGKVFSRFGGFLEGVDRFDARFFEMTPREARHVDPRQRLLLEVAWEALEDAGLPRQRLAGSATAVFMAALTNDWAQLLEADPSRIDAYAGPGAANAVLSNRLSYFLDLRGPSATVDTACSGSLVAIHLACQALRSGDAEVALAGGANLLLLPNGNIFFSKAGALSPDGRCKSFDHRANGIVRSDGVAVLVLKPLAAALADGDRIHAVIRGSAVNQDGRSDGLVAPNGQAQEAVLRQAYRRAGVPPGQVQYIEAHGTGTSLGDPIEARALWTVLREGRGAGRRWMLGSIKSNLGHTEAAAGAAGVIKVALAMQHRRIPASLHFERPNPLIPLAEMQAAVPQAAQPWPYPEERLRAGVSSFGVGGTNAHLVLEEAPLPAPQAPRDAAGPYLLPLSARGPDALRELASAWRATLAAGEAPLPDLVYTAQKRRTHFEHRLAVLGEDGAALAASLEAFVAGRAAPDLASGSHLGGRRPPVAFVFSGQGSQWPGMGLFLLRSEPVFQSVLEKCDRLFRALTGEGPIATLEAPDAAARLERTAIAQPAIFSVQVALAALWRAYGVEPSAVIGQSLGEVAAACVAGALSLEDAAAVVAHRGRLMSRVEGRGRTAVVGLPFEEAARTLEGFAGRLEVAGSNSPATTVVAGEPEAMARYLAGLERRQIFCRQIPGVELAFHSPQMDPLRPDLEAALAKIRPRREEIPIVSTVTAQPIAGEAMDAAYWGRNLREPFRFAAAFAQLPGAAGASFLEVSPHAVLGDPMRQILRGAGRPAPVLASMVRGGDERRQVLATAGALYALGHPLRWERLPPSAGRCVRVPTYPWQRQRYWFDTSAAAPSPPAAAQVPEEPPGHPLLGPRLGVASVSFAAGLVVWERTLHAAPSYLADHRVARTAVVPAAAYVELMLAAGAQAGGGRPPPALREVELVQMLPLPASPWQVQVVLETGADATRTGRVQVFSRLAPRPQGEAPWTLHATGRLAPAAGPPVDVEPLSAARARCGQALSRQEHYRALARCELHYGPAFQGVQQVHRREGEALADLELPVGLREEAARYRIHPALLDAVFQVAAAAAGMGGGESTFLPAGVEAVEVFSALPPSAIGHARIRPHAGQEDPVRLADLDLRDAQGRAIASVRGLRLHRLESAADLGGRGVRSLLHDVVWRPSPPARAAAPAAGEGTWILLADPIGIADALAKELGGRAILLRAGRGESGPAGEGAEVVYVDPASGERLDQALDAALRRGGDAVRGVVYLWSLGADPAGEPAVEGPELLRAGGLGGAVRLIQALLRHPQAASRRPPPLWLVTRGAQAPAGPAPLRLEGTPLAGLGRVVVNELPELQARMVDLDPARDPAAAARELKDELLSPDGEDQVALRGGVRHVRRVVPAARGPGRRAGRPFSRDASYLITGGLGGLGLAVARWMVEQGARRLLLLGRTALPPREQWGQLGADHPQAGRVAAVRELEALGASVHVAGVDVGDRRALAAFLEDHRRQGLPPIRGVIHAAGAVADRLLARMDDEHLAAPLGPKVQGGLWLHQLLGGEGLDFFVLFSSAASLAGFPGQAAYAAANAFLDGLAQHRRAMGLPGLSINWGSWGEVGMAAGEAVQAQHGARGVRPMAPARALQALAVLLAEGEAAQKLVIDLDWAAWRRQAAVVPPMFEALGQEGEFDEAAGGPSQAASLPEQLAAAREGERAAILLAHLQRLVGATVRMAPAEIAPEQPLSALGIDSILTAEIQARIRAATGITVPVTQLLAGPPLAEICTRILAELDAARSAELPG